MAATIKVSPQGEQQLLLQGELTFYTAKDSVVTVTQALQHSQVAVTDASSQQPQWLLDLADITHADSAGMAFVCEIERYAQDNNLQIKWVNIPKQIANIAQVSGLEPLFTEDQPKTD